MIVSRGRAGGGSSTQAANETRTQREQRTQRRRGAKRRGAKRGAAKRGAAKRGAVKRGGHRRGARKRGVNRTQWINPSDCTLSALRPRLPLRPLRFYSPRR